MLEIKNLTVQVKNGAPILTDVSLSIDEGTCIGLTGASGSGKTTLIKSIMGMNGGDLEIPQGQILLDGDNLLTHGTKERRTLCGKTIGFIPQNPMTAFFPHAKMERQIIETLRMHTGLDKKTGPCACGKCAAASQPNRYKASAECISRRVIRGYASADCYGADFGDEA